MCGQTRSNDLAIPLVRVEAVVKELTQEASALRDAEDVGDAPAHGQVGAIPEGRRRVADGGQADAGDARAGRREVDFIDASRLEPAVEDQARPAVGCRRRRTASAARQRRRLLAKQVAHRERRGRVVRIDRRVRGGRSFNVASVRASFWMVGHRDAAGHVRRPAPRRAGSAGRRRTASRPRPACSPRASGTRRPCVRRSSGRCSPARG